MKIQTEEVKQQNITENAKMVPNCNINDDDVVVDDDNDVLMMMIMLMMLIMC